MSRYRLHYAALAITASGKQLINPHFFHFSLASPSPRVAQVASMAASMERNKAAAREEVEAERQAAERTRESLEAAQVNSLRAMA